MAVTPPPALAHVFGALDWLVLSLYGAATLGIGFYFWRKQRTADTFFLGNRSTNPVIAGVSIFAALFSVISYIGGPGEYVQNGPVLVFVNDLLTFPAVFVVVAWLVIPRIMRLPVTSAYELLEQRFGRVACRIASCSYIFGRLVWMAVILFTCSTVLTSAVGGDASRAWVFAAAIGVVTTTYTLCGGIEGLMVTQVLQFCILLAAAVLTVVSVSHRLGGVAVWWPRHWEPHWAPQPFFSWDPHVRVTVVGTFVSAICFWTCMATADQATVQRFLTTRDAKAARRAYLFQGAANGTITIVLGLAGAAVLAFYRLHPEGIPPHASFARRGDAFFPHYISHYLPSGISGLVVASLLAAAMACISSGTNALITVIFKDFIEVAGPKRSEAAKLRTTRLVAVAIGIVVIIGSLGMGYIPGNLVEISAKTINLLIYPLYGFFFLAIYVPFATPFGAVVGAVYSLTAGLLVGYWDVLTGRPGLSFQWIGIASVLVGVTSGCLFSLVPTRGRKTAVVGSYGAAAMAGLALVVLCLVTRLR